MARKIDHLKKAMESMIAAQTDMEKTVSGHSKILQSQGQDIAKLEQQVMQLRNHAISAEVRSGVPSKTVAEKYGVSAGRVTQIAPRRTH